MDDKEALRSYELEPRSTEPPRPTWCPGCGSTVIDPAVESVCVDCEAEAGRLLLTKDLQSEDK